MIAGSDYLQVLCVRIDHAGRKEAVERISSFIETPGCKVVVTVNPEHVMLAENSDRFKKILNSSELNVPDGTGIVVASWLLGEPLRERVTGADLLPRICRLCAEKGVGIFLLGGKPGIAKQAAAKLVNEFPGLIVAGTSSRDPGPEMDTESVNEINESGARVLAVAYGSPKENIWIERNRGQFKTIRVAIGVGGALDFISGETRRAPRIMRKAGLEWLFRLWLEPGRFWRMAALPRFGWRVLKSRWGTGNNAPPAGPD